MLLQKRAQEQAEILDEVLLIVLPVGVGQADVGVQRQHLNRDNERTSDYSTDWKQAEEEKMVKCGFIGVCLMSSPV